MQPITAEYLQQMPVFGPVPLPHLQWLISKAECRELAVGEILFDKGDPADQMLVILDGQVDIYLEQNGQYKQTLSLKKGDVTGVLPYSRLKTAGGRGVAAQPTALLALHRQHFSEMEQVSPELVQELVALMTDRVREFTRNQQQNEKLMALGKLSAGLAHELNNPAAAIVRSSSELLKIHHSVPEKFKRVISMRVTSSQVDEVNAILFGKIESGLKNNNALSLLARTNLEDELADWLQDKDAEDPYGLAETFADAGITLAELETIDGILQGQHLNDVLEWIANTLNTERLICDIQAASKRISELVNAVKTYSHMDRGQDKEPTDLHTGLRSTLTMLGHKIKEKNIQVTTDFDPNLPPVEVFVSELNQVWTNILDNAIDAMDNGGELRLTTRHEGQFVKVEIADTGSGIPPELVTRIFEPFFTTKAMGKGTGLGLDIVNKIIQKHNADIKVKSEPGNTVFYLCFPLK